jgi:hypothetical protein
VKYDEADVEAANGASAQILLELGENEKETLKKAKEDAGRAFAVLERDYDEVRRWALPIWQDEDLVPTLYSVRGAGRTPRRGGSGGANQGGSTTGSTKPT